jgi:hydroxypyruvate reductase
VSATRNDRARLRQAASRILRAGLEACEPEALTLRALRRLAPRAPRGRLLVLAAGKAAPAMARAARAVLGDSIAHGVVVSPTSAAVPPGFEMHLAGHPVPNDGGLQAAAAVEASLRGLKADDVVLVLLSGGASALLPAPVDGIGLADKAATTSLLLRSGASIHELNAVRKHLSRLKGGGLARSARPARVVALLLSDVVGDDTSVIASGPTSADPSTYASALRVLGDHGVLAAVPEAVRRHLEEGAAGLRPETPKPGDEVFRRVSNHIVGSGSLAVSAAAREARRLRLRPEILTTRLEGEAREVARVLVAILHERAARGRAALLATGETTVTVRGAGRGGRNQELVLAAAAALEGFPGPALVASLGTDGVDGASDAAGGIADDSSAARARALGLAPIRDFLDRNDSWAFLATLGDLIVTGPTGTNVGDLVLLLAEKRD